MLHTFPVQIHTYKMSQAPNLNVFYPQVAEMPNHQLQRLINQTIIHETQQLINEQIGNMPTTVEEMIGLYEIKNNQQQILSLSLSNYTYHHQAAHGLTVIKSLSFDLEKGNKLELHDLFKPGSDYVERLSALIAEQIKRRDIPILEEFTGIRPDQDFYIADKTLVIYFQLYEITPYAFGFPMFPISLYDLQDLIDENGPLGRLIENN